MGAMADEVLLGGSHVVPARLSREGFEFKYPGLDEAIGHIVAREIDSNGT